MAEPKKVTQEKYDALRTYMEDRYGYDKMSDADKERFDTAFDALVTVTDKPDDTGDDDPADNVNGRGGIERGRTLRREMDDEREM